jgi:hypothetical protein
MTSSFRGRVMLLAMASLIPAGCGGDQLERYRIRGTVTFEGRPVQTGGIIFEPTESVGKVAPTAYLRVQDGKFDAGDEGPVAGKYNVIVGGTDPSRTLVDNEGIAQPAKLFEEYRFEVEIPPPNDTLDVEVPASQAIRPK